MDNKGAGQTASDEVVEPAQPSPGMVRSALGSFTTNQKRALAVMTVISVAFGAYFLRGYLELIALAAVLAYLFTPLYRRFNRKRGTGFSAAMTFLCAVAIVIIPLGGILALAGVQIAQMINTVSTWVGQTDMGELGRQLMAWTNDALSKIPFIHVEITPDRVHSFIASVATNVGEFALGFAQRSVGSIASMVTSAIIFIYVFVAMLIGAKKLVATAKDLSPLDPKITDVYIAKIGAMVKATVGGQFIIAIAQGLAGAISIYIAGIHQGFAMFVIFLSVLSIIPLGSGIVTIPMGIVMALSGNIPGGIFVVLFHVLVTSNIDNILRPMLVPKTAYLPASVMLLAVFAGLSMFGFVGIVFGPVIMIVIVTTINLYRSVAKGATWEEDFDDEDTGPKKKGFWGRLKDRLARKKAAKQQEAEDAGDVPEPAEPTAVS